MKKHYLQPALEFYSCAHDVLRTSNTDPVLEDGFAVKEEGIFF